MVCFSIVIPTYNCEKTIQTAIESILVQTYRSFEVLIIDGLSSDNTMPLVRQYAQKDNRIKFISEKDGGIYDAMNKAIKRATGQWLYFLGADDSLYNENILKLLSEKLDGFDVVYGNVYSKRFNGVYDGPFTEEKIWDRNICHQSVFVSRQVFNKIGSFNVQYKSHADWDHNMHWFLSPRIKKKYIDLVISNYADGGYSSTYFDYIFDSHRLWNYTLYKKRRMSFIKKVKVILGEFKKAVKKRHYRFLVKIIVETPSLLFP